MSGRPSEYGKATWSTIGSIIDVRVGTRLVGEERVAALEVESARLVALNALRALQLPAVTRLQLCQLRACYVPSIATLRAAIYSPILGIAGNGMALR